MKDILIRDALIQKDERITRQFFYQNCRPLLYKLIGEIFSTNVDYDELVSELYLYLMEDDARRLKSFGGESSIYQWMKTVARRFFLDIKSRGQVIENKSREPLYERNDEMTDPSRQEAQMDVAALLDQITNERYRLVQRPRGCAVYDVAVAEITQLLVRLRPDIRLRDNRIAFLLEPAQILVNLHLLEVAQRHDVHARQHGDAMHSRCAARANTDESDANTLHRRQGEILHRTAFAEVEAIYPASGGERHRTHPCSALEEIASFHFCRHFWPPFIYAFVESAAS